MTLTTILSSRRQMQRSGRRRTVLPVANTGQERNNKWKLCN